VTKNIKNEIEAKLRESEVRYRRLFETAYDGILILDSKTGQITDVNPYLENLLGYSKNQFLNKKLWEVGPFKNRKEAKESFKVIQKEGYVRYDDLPLEAKDGKIIQVEYVCNSYMADKILVIQCNIRDITERKKIELVKETERFLEEERMKIESIADATHELRTPVAIIKGNVDLALNKYRGKSLKSPESALMAIDYEIKHLSIILSDLTLITSKSGEVKNRIQYNKVSLSALIHKVAERCEALGFKKNISIIYKKIPKISFIGDRIYLEKMLVNLVKNSIVYGNLNGKTKIQARKSKGFIEIDVIDNGIGISEDDVSHVFERFYRSDKSRHSTSNSIGLGLAIVKWVADFHGGTVSVEKAKGGGSIFKVRLPIKKASN